MGLAERLRTEILYNNAPGGGDMGIVSGCVDWEQVRREKNPLTVRDQFAMSIIQGMAANDYWAQNINGEQTSMDGAARVAYQMANAMIRARGR